MDIQLALHNFIVCQSHIEKATTVLISRLKLNSQGWALPPFLVLLVK